ncbi:uncharacterized protein MELLADRAFT_92497 [Melampsora larici-populina 98AG31]|uniref:Uncharacterized protein n=1 Tax=Melampsora larici-populina (strain 98AG31 / pathotype 3-4-7) TaxID=747676 RepID=F4R8N9_MELLP|nr:uncharacterized protein MELLADRAFT_92497 [Melampsora larici-populina 98AG31]EGG11082.1 hypothetical protein MELLADRAFT_92497 [Melampsora larici-populina 98AG31]
MDHLDENEEEEEEDIESMIKKELEDIKASKPTHSLVQRFVYKKTDCECLGFIRFPKGRNPIQFINHMVKKVHEGQPGSGLRYIQRVTPVTATCPSTSLTAFKSLVTQVLKPYFGLDRTTSSTSFGLQYRIEPIIRCHDQPLNRTEVIKSIGEIVEDFNSEKYIGIKPLEDQVDSRIPLKHKVNLNNAKVVILVSVYKYVVGISVVSDYDQECKRFNLQAIAEAREKTQLDTSAKLKPIEVMPTDSSISICS